MADLDLDAELLALAGDDSSGEDSVPSAPKRKSPSPRQQSPPADTSRKSVTKAKKVRRRKDYSDNDEESEASQRSASASMSHSDSEAEFAPAEDKPIFPYEKYYYDAADKAAIQAKPEIEREDILAQRAEQVVRHEQDLTLRRMIASRQKAEARNKRKAEAADLDDSQRKSSRQRTKLGGGKVGEASSAIEAYKKQRAEKSVRDEQRRNKPASRDEELRDNDYSDADAEGESENDFDDRRYKRRTPTPPKDDPIVELSDIQRARVGRDNFAEVCYTPGFEGAITDCYARVCIGPGVYRVCTITGFTKGKPYAMSTANGRTFLVDQYIMAAHGKAQKAWSFLECSMSKFTDDEWRRYRLTMANEDCKMPTKGFISAKLDQINKLLKHKFSEAEISDKIKRQGMLMDQVNRVAEKKAIKDQIHDAEMGGHDETVAELEEKLANLVPMKLALGTTLNRPDSNYVDKEQEKLAELNRRNQRLTQENVRKAQLAEMRHKKAKKLLAPATTDSLFGDSDISRSGTPVTGLLGDTASRSGTPSASQTANEALNTNGGTNGTPKSSGVMTNGSLNPTKPKKGLPTIRKSARDDEIMAGLDLGIDIEI